MYVTIKIRLVPASVLEDTNAAFKQKKLTLVIGLVVVMHGRGQLDLKWYGWTEESVIFIDINRCGK